MNASKMLVVILTTRGEPLWFQRQAPGYDHQRLISCAMGPNMEKRFAAAFRIAVNWSFSEFDHGAARQRRISRDHRRSTLEHMPRGVLLVVGIFGRQAIYGDDHLVSALCRTRAGANAYTLKRSAAHDDHFNAGPFQLFL
jgi:hypothetical protein